MVFMIVVIVDHHLNQLLVYVSWTTPIAFNQLRKLVPRIRVCQLLWAASLTIGGDRICNSWRHCSHSEFWLKAIIWKMSYKLIIHHGFGLLLILCLLISLFLRLRITRVMYFRWYIVTWRFSIVFAFGFLLVHINELMSLAKNNYWINVFGKR